MPIFREQRKGMDMMEGSKSKNLLTFFSKKAVFSLFWDMLFVKIER
jgi:hypothetical protein